MRKHLRAGIVQLLFYTGEFLFRVKIYNVKYQTIRTINFRITWYFFTGKIANTSVTRPEVYVCGNIYTAELMISSKNLSVIQYS